MQKSKFTKIITQLHVFICSDTLYIVTSDPFVKSAHIHKHVTKDVDFRPLSEIVYIVNLVLAR